MKPTRLSTVLLRRYTSRSYSGLKVNTFPKVCGSRSRSKGYLLIRSHRRSRNKLMGDRDMMIDYGRVIKDIRIWKMPK